MPLAFHGDERHVVFPSFFSCPQRLDQSPGLRYGNPNIRGAMRDEHLAPYGSAGREQIPPECRVISPTEQVEKVQNLG
jgi:hypothetical protein